VLLDLATDAPADASRLLVALHGHGDDPRRFATALEPVARSADRSLVVPIGPVHAADGRAWFPSLDDDAGPGLASTLDRLDATIGSITERTGVDLVLLGWSQGAATALAAVARSGAAARPRVVVALAPWMAHEPGVTWDLASANGTRFVLVHGVDDLVVPVQQGRSAARVLERAGLDVELVEVPTGHDLATLLDVVEHAAGW